MLDCPCDILSKTGIRIEGGIEARIEAGQILPAGAFGMMQVVVMLARLGARHLLAPIERQRHAIGPWRLFRGFSERARDHAGHMRVPQDKTGARDKADEVPEQHTGNETHARPAACASVPPDSPRRDCRAVTVRWSERLHIALSLPVPGGDSPVLKLDVDRLEAAIANGQHSTARRWISTGFWSAVPTLWS